MLNQVARLYDYRYFVLSSIRNEFKTKFSRSKLGMLWAVINPLVQSVVYATVLSSIISAKLPGIENKYSYALYLLSGMAAWALFQEVTIACMNVFVERGELMKKVSFPRACLPMISSGVALINNVLLLIAVSVVFIFLDYSFSPSITLLPILIALNFLMALAIGTLLGILNVLIRDIGQVTLVIMQALFWLTPIVYTPNILPDKVRPILEMSPVYQLVESYHAIMVYGVLPDAKPIGYVAIFMLIVSILAIVVYRRAGSDMADAL